MNIKFQHQTSLVKESSFGVTDEKNDVTLSVEIEIDNNHRTGGWYEFYDESDPDNWYAGGVLEIQDGELIGYDGCYSLPDFIINKLAEVGIKDGL